MYETQNKMIYNLLESFKGQIQTKAMIESPTGSGKSVCCISAYLGYYNTYSEAARLLEYINSIVQHKLDYTQESVYETLINRNLIQYDKDHYDILFRFIQNYRPLSDCLKVYKSFITCKIDDEKMFPPTLIYCSRTHEQLKQLTQQTLSLFYHGLNVSYISSREHSCSNEQVLEEARKTRQSIQNICKAHISENKCRYNSQKTEFIRAADIEDFKKQCSQQSLCSYYCSINNIEQAQIIFTPYNYVIDPELQNQILRGKLRNSIIIFDEAHSLASFAKNSFSLNFTRDELMAADDNLSLALSLLEVECSLQEQKKQHQKTREQLQLKRQVFLAFQQYLHQFRVNLDNIMMLSDKTNKYSQEGILLFSKIPLRSIKAQIIDYENEVEQLIYQYARSKLQQGEPPDSPLMKRLNEVKYNSFPKFGQLLNIGIYISENEDYFDAFKLIINKIDHEKGNKRLSFDLACFTPSIAFQRILKLNPLSINFVSGTLSPMNYIEEQYQSKFQIKVQLDHIANLDDQLICYNIIGINDTFKFIGTYNNRNEEYFMNVCKTILSITQNLPQGTGCLIFVSSYQILQEFKRLLELKQQWIKHKNTNIIFESKKQNTIQQYKQSVLEDKKLTLMIAVQRGQLAEGIDFKDDLCRCIIIVGIPFPDQTSLIFQEQLLWLDKQKGQLKSKEYLMMEAFTAVNQAIGRGIRHKNDYCEIVLLDQRYQQQLKYLPKYIEKRVQPVVLHNFGNQYTTLPYFNNQIQQTLKSTQQQNDSESDISDSFSDILSPQQEQQNNENDNINQFLDDFNKDDFNQEVQIRQQNSQIDQQQIDQYFEEKQLYSVLQQLRRCNKFMLITQFKKAIIQVNNTHILVSMINEFQQIQERGKLISIVLAIK